MSIFPFNRGLRGMVMLCVVTGMLVMTAFPALARAQTPLQFMHRAKLGLFVHYVYGLTDAAPGKPPLKNLKQFAADLNVNAMWS